MFNPIEKRRDSVRARTPQRIDRRVRDEAGFTLIELLIVLVIIGILLAVAVPSYLGFKDSANASAAKANVRTAVPAIEAYYADNATYVGMSLAALQAIDSGIELATVGTVTATSYCIDASVNGNTWRKSGPTATIVTGACP